MRTVSGFLRLRVLCTVIGGLLLFGSGVVVARAQDATETAADATSPSSTQDSTTSEQPEADNSADVAAPSSVAEPPSSAALVTVDDGLVAKFNKAMEPVNVQFGVMNGYIAQVIFYPMVAKDF